MKNVKRAVFIINGVEIDIVDLTTLDISFEESRDPYLLVSIAGNIKETTPVSPPVDNSADPQPIETSAAPQPEDTGAPVKSRPWTASPSKKGVLELDKDVVDAATMLQSDPIESDIMSEEVAKTGSLSEDTKAIVAKIRKNAKDGSKTDADIVESIIEEKE